MGVKLGVSHRGKNVDWRCVRIGGEENTWPKREGGIRREEKTT
jgi:hypothetical protein